MAETLLAMRTRVKLRCGNKSGIDDVIDDNLNEATRQVVVEMKPQECWEDITFSTTSGTSNYSFSTIGVSTTVYAVLMVRDDTDDVEVLRGGIREYNRVRRDTDDSSNLGDPRRWTRQENSLILYSKIPDDATRTVRMTYLELPDEMSSDTDTFPLNEEWRLPVERLATALTWADLNDMNKHNMNMSLFREMLALRDKPESLEDEAPEAQLVPYIEDYG